MAFLLDDNSYRIQPSNPQTWLVHANCRAVALSLQAQSMKRGQPAYLCQSAFLQNALTSFSHNRCRTLSGESELGLGHLKYHFSLVNVKLQRGIGLHTLNQLFHKVQAGVDCILKRKSPFWKSICTSKCGSVKRRVWEFQCCLYFSFWPNRKYGIFQPFYTSESLLVSEGFLV